MAMAMAVVMVSDFGTMARYGVRRSGEQSMTGAGSERGIFLESGERRGGLGMDQDTGARRGTDEETWARTSSGEEVVAGRNS